MTKTAFLYAAYILSAFLLVAQPLPDRPQTLSSEIKLQLQELKKQSDSLTESLAIVTHDYKALMLTRSQLETELTELSLCLTDTKQKLNSYERKLENYENALAFKAKVIAVLLTLFLIRAAGMVAGYVLYFKGIKLPRWLDILL